MAGKLSAAQHAVIRRKAKPKELDPADEAGELNIVPFLDIITNILMFILATITTVFTATISVPAPRASSGPGAPSDNEEINITVKVVREGYIVGAPGGFLQPGCTAVAQAAITVPLQGGQHDAEGLTRCMVAIRSNPEWRAQLENRRNINVAVNGDLPYHVLVKTLDALRETRPGARDLFTEPALGILN
jgi:biopolymer transport protein ExbD